MYTRPSAPRSTGGVLDDAFRLYRESFAHTWPLALAASVIVTIPGILLTLSVGDAKPDMETAMRLLQAPHTWFIGVAAMLAYVVFYNALVVALDAIAKGRKISLGEAVAVGSNRVPRMLAVILLFTLMIVAGSILFIVPGIYLWGVFQLAFVAVIVDDAGVLDSFRISQRIIKGHWWRSGTILSIAVIILLVFDVAVDLIVGVVASVLDMRPVAVLIGQQLLSMILDVFLLALLPSVYLAMYYDLKLRTEGDDLAARVQTLSAQ